MSDQVRMDDSSNGLTFFTVGHSSRSLADFIELVTAAGVTCIVDVRGLPGSRAFPQYNSENLAGSLAQIGMHYVHVPELGGRRRRSLSKDDHRNDMWRNASFRYYADYALTPAFATALDDLERRAQDDRCALMCAEAVWWRCHRRIITDYLLMRGHHVFHIMGKDKLTTATMTPGAQIVDGVVTYPAVQDS